MLFAYNRVKEAKYLTECLVNSGREAAVKIFSSQIFQKFEDEEWKNNVIQTLSRKADLDMEEIEDRLSVGKTSQEEISKQTKRLYAAYLNGREFQEKNFDHLCSVEPFKSLYSRLIWGEYKGDKL